MSMNRYSRNRYLDFQTDSSSGYGLGPSAPFARGYPAEINLEIAWPAVRGLSVGTVFKPDSPV